LLLSSVKSGENGAEEARETLDRMVDAGWYCSTSFYAKILERLEKLEGE
jgi:hypothetical protein